VQVKRYGRLHHNHAGVVSLSHDGSEVAISLSKAISLDKDYQVCSGSIMVTPAGQQLNPQSRPALCTQNPDAFHCAPGCGART
jgi:hypothetical protein